MKRVCWLAVLIAVAGLGCQSSALTAAKLYIKQEQPQEAKKTTRPSLADRAGELRGSLAHGPALGK